MINAQRVLVLAPHTDDGELGCGGTIARMIGEGKESAVIYVAFSCAEESILSEFSKNILETEVKEATAKLGIPKCNLTIKHYPVRKLAEYRQEILEYLVEVNKDFKPDLIFTPSIHDLHQDHETVTKEALRAFKYRTILGYELPWNNLTFDADCFIEISDMDLDCKIEALKSYQSQIHRQYMSPEFISSLALVRGLQINVEYAEAFNVLRMVI